MELEQLAKRVQWLDDERRKDKNSIAQLEERLLSLERLLAASDQKNTDLSGEVTRLKTIINRMDNFDEAMVLHRKEILKQIQTQEKQSAQRDDEILSVLRAEIRTFEAPIFEIRRDLEVTRGLKTDLAARVSEENRLSRGLDELKKEMIDLRRSEEEQSRIYRLLEDGRRQDTKRITDLQGELVALRKRADEQRGRADVTDTTLRRLETRLNELVMAEEERGEAQTAFQEKQALIAVEREAVWKDWKARFDTIEKQSVDVENQLQSLDATYMNVKRTQEAVDDLMLRVERRINEVAEIQRLAEERFRQEWNTFKADDQTRWTNYTLSQDEQRGEIGRRFDRLTDRITYIEDSLQEVRDVLQYTNELNSQSLTSLLAAIHDWTSGYERSTGAAR
jgi:chromosome segregation ATPase